MKTMLIVDDEPAIRSIISRWAETRGYAVAEADGADAGLARMHQRAADVAVCDLNMPGHDGRWFAEEVRKAFPETGVVMITGVDKREAEARIPEGVVTWLVKPFRLSDLVQAMDQVVIWRQAHVTLHQ